MRWAVYGASVARRLSGVLLVVGLCGCPAASGGGGSSKKDTSTASGPCDNGQKDNDETDIDCGGACGGCDEGKSYAADGDCTSAFCGPGYVCWDAGCSNGEMDGDETGVDCGGQCPQCAGGTCNTNDEWITGFCNTGICDTPSCTDGIKNGLETGVDCAGDCPLCADGRRRSPRWRRYWRCWAVKATEPAPALTTVSAGTARATPTAPTPPTATATGSARRTTKAALARTAPSIPSAPGRVLPRVAARSVGRTTAVAPAARARRAIPAVVTASAWTTPDRWCATTSTCRRTLCAPETPRPARASAASPMGNARRRMTASVRTALRMASALTPPTAPRMVSAPHTTSRASARIA
ncbi:MAG: hypothetical protein ACI9WU_003458 [Myxococcota bacterium]|jgi:hypothetical protein